MEVWTVGELESWLFTLESEQSFMPTKRTEQLRNRLMLVLDMMREPCTVTDRSNARIELNRLIAEINDNRWEVKED